MPSRDATTYSRHQPCGYRTSPPLGHEVKSRKLVQNTADAAHVRWVFARFIEIGPGTVMARELAEGRRRSGGSGLINQPLQKVSKCKQRLDGRHVLL